jgi:hypothetical protein
MRRGKLKKQMFQFHDILFVVKKLLSRDVTFFCQQQSNFSNFTSSKGTAKAKCVFCCFPSILPYNLIYTLRSSRQLIKCAFEKHFHFPRSAIKAIDHKCIKNMVIKYIVQRYDNLSCALCI